jgi:endo-1,4-beta-D-glucanase Y
MRHPKSTSHSLVSGARAGLSAVVGFALLAGCAGPLRPDTGTGSAGTTGAAGTSSGGTGSGATAGSAAGGSAGTGTAGITTGGIGGRGGAAGTGGSAIGAAGTTGAGGMANTDGGVAGGAAGTGGVGGSGGTGGTKPPRGPTPAANGVNFPFPQNREISRCVYPVNYLNTDVMTAWTQFKTDTVVSAGNDKDGMPMRRIQRTSSDPVNMYTPAMSTVSEGIAYAMLIAVYMGTTADQSLFDDLWRYSQAHLNANGLMNWAIASNGTMVTGMGGATDADEDIAFALLMADKQWGGKGSLKGNYIDLAKAQINNVWLHEIVDSKLAGPGDSWGATDLWKNINISYFAPAYYRIFKMVDPGHAWDAVITTSYDTILSPNNTLDKGALKPANMNTNNGLVPAWCTSTGDPSMTTPFNYQYDSCRTPFRIALDWCWFGETRAQLYLQKTSTFFSGIGAANIVDGYDLNGNRKGQFFTGTGAPTLAQQSAAFLGPAGVGAMVSNTYQTFVNDSYTRVATGQLKIGGAYYDESWTALSLLMMTGNMLDYTSIQPVH